jgi:hypothetical protein
VKYLSTTSLSSEYIPKKIKDSKVKQAQLGVSASERRQAQRAGEQIQSTYSIYLCEKRTMKAAEIVLRRGRKGMRGE